MHQKDVQETMNGERAALTKRELHRERRILSLQNQQCHPNGSSYDRASRIVGCFLLECLCSIDLLARHLRKKCFGYSENLLLTIPRNSWNAPGCLELAQVPSTITFCLDNFQNHFYFSLLITT